MKIAVEGASREEVVVALAREANRMQEEDRGRLEIYERASERYHSVFRRRRRRIAELPLLEAHEELLRLARDLLPMRPAGEMERGTT